MNELAKAPLTLAVLESFYVGGNSRDVTTQVFGPDTQVSGAMYVQRIAPAEISLAAPGPACYER